MTLPPNPNQANEHGQVIDPALLSRNRRLLSIDGGVDSLKNEAIGMQGATAIIKMLGGGDQHIGIYGGFSNSFYSLFQFMGPLVLDKTRSNRAAYLLALAGMTVCNALLVFLFFFASPSATPGPVLYLYLAFCFVPGILTGLQQNVTANWIGDLVPVEKRGWFQSLRYIFINAASVVSLLLAGRYVDRHNTLHGFAFLFLCAVLLSTVNFWVILRATDRKPKEAHFFGKKSERMAWSSGAFWCFNAYRMLWTMGRNIIRCFIPVFLFEVMHWSFVKTTSMFIIPTILGIGLIFILGRVTDRTGNRLPCILISLIAGLGTNLWISSAWLGSKPIVIYYLVIGAFVNYVQSMPAMNLSLEIFPDKGRSHYLAVSRILGGLAGLAGPAVMGFVLLFLKSFRWEIGGAVLGRYHLAFFIGEMLCLLSAVPLIMLGNRKVEVPEPVTLKPELATA